MSHRNRKGIWAAAIAVCLLAVAVYWGWRSSYSGVQLPPAEPLPQLESKETLREQYDVIVAGTDPEGVAAAVSAARNGLKVLLVDGKQRDRLGGLITLGWLNSLDLNYSPAKSLVPGKHAFLNKGIFQEWYDELEGTSIDVQTAAAQFHRLVEAEPNIDLLVKVQSMRPKMDGHTVVGMDIVDKEGLHREAVAKAIIDATQDADVAALAGVPFTTGREDLGQPDARMAVTLVFKLSGVTEEIWRSFGKREDTGIDKMSAWGFLDAKLYESSDPKRVGMRGLNIGRQNDGTILINAMHLFGIDPLDPASVKEGYEIGEREAPRITAFLKGKFKELEKLEYAGVAPELYIRESRHMVGEYRLSMADLMQNKDFWDAIAYGSYDVDIQRLGVDDSGSIMMSPLQYGVPFRALVPKQIDGLLVVGRSASFDSLPHGSARVIPLGMATGEAAGAAVKLAISEGISLRELSRSEQKIVALRMMLTKQGMDLDMHVKSKPHYTKHKAYKGLLAAVSMNMTIGGYGNNKWDLNGAADEAQFLNMMQKLRESHPGHFQGSPGATKLVNKEGRLLSLDKAAYALCAMTGIRTSEETAVGELLQRGWISKSSVAEIKNTNSLTNGDTFMLIRDITEFYAGEKYE
ncbi:FAD-dependent oxidoreductase [Paenibacillus sp. GCM10027627]|uniref:FAD-dependent oxidoreductase n=1 Tax=unclassified Paenibacillus TaxID=185978 RepID=UPI00363615A2